MMVEMITRLEEFHNCGYLHRDIKPDNFCLGGRNLQEVFLIDFGLSLQYLNSEGEHVPMQRNKGFVGTPRYASRNAHNGLTQSRRDDMEAIGHLAIYLIKGRLPWQSVKEKDRKKKHKLLYEKKSSFPVPELCENIPRCFETYLILTRQMEYKQKPEYEVMRQMFVELAKECNEYHWEALEEYQDMKNDYLKGGREDSMAGFTESSYNNESSQRSHAGDSADIFDEIPEEGSVRDTRNT